MRMDRRRFLTGSIATASALTLAPTRARAQMNASAGHAFKEAGLEVVGVKS